MRISYLSSSQDSWKPDSGRAVGGKDPAGKAEHRGRVLENSGCAFPCGMEEEGCHGGRQGPAPHSAGASPDQDASRSGAQWWPTSISLETTYNLGLKHQFPSRSHIASANCLKAITILQQSWPYLCAGDVCSQRP